MRCFALLTLMLLAAGCADAGDTSQASEQSFELSLSDDSQETADAVLFNKVTTTGDAPSRRSAPSTAVLDRSLLVFGGVFDDFSTQTNGFYNDLYRFDLRTRAWSKLDTRQAPAPRAFAPAVTDVARDRVLVFGGTNYDAAFSDVKMFDDLWALTESPLAWTQLRTRNAGPSARSGAALWIAGHSLYVFGGVESTFAMKNDLWALDLRSLEWTQVIADGTAGSPPGRHVAQVTPTPLYGRVTLYGGEGLDPQTFSFTDLADTWQLDLRTLKWTNVTPAPDHDLVPSRNYAASAVLGRTLYLSGGDLPGGSKGCGAPFEQNVTNEVWGFDLRERVWSHREVRGTLPPAIKRAGYAALGSNLFIVGGWDFSCPNGQGPGQVWNTNLYVLRASSDDR